MKSLAHLATKFVGTPIAMHPPKLEIILKALVPRLGIQADISAIESNADEATQRLVAHYQEAGADRSYQVLDGVAIIPVQGTLMKRLSGMAAWSGGCSYEEIQSQISQAVNDGGVNSLLLDIDSPGGEVSGCFELADFIHSMRGKKPIYAVANDCALSAAYAIACSADRIFVGRTGAVGSIGVFALHAEQAEFDKQIGVKYTYIFAGDCKVDGNPHTPLSDRARAEIQTEVSREYGIFTETVARNRAADVKEIVATQARLMWADAAVPLLADEVGTFDDAMNALVSLNGSGNKQPRSTRAAAPSRSNTMADTTIAASAPCDTEDPEMNKGKKAADPADKNKDGEESEESDGDKDAKAAAAAALQATPVAAAPAVVAPAAESAPVSSLGSRTEDDIVAIGNLCKMAGLDSSLYLTKKATSGSRYLTVAEISNDIAENRSAESARTPLMNNVDMNAGGKLTVERLQTEATAFARANSRSEASNLYVEGTRKGTTPEQAFAASLEANPEAYGEFRDRHNAGALVATLQKVGIKVQFS